MQRLKLTNATIKESASITSGDLGLESDNGVEVVNDSSNRDIGVNNEEISSQLELDAVLQHSYTLVKGPFTVAIDANVTPAEVIDYNKSSVACYLVAPHSLFIYRSIHY